VDATSFDVKTFELVSLDMSVSQLGHERDRVKAGVFSQGVGNKLKALAILTDAVGVGSEDFSGVGLKFLRDFHLASGTTWKEGPLLDKGSDDAEGIVERSFSLLEHKLVGTSYEDRDSLVLGGATSDLDDLLVGSSTDLLNKFGSSELILGELINMGDGDSVDSLADEVNIVTLDVLDDHNALLGEEMEGKFVDGVSKDRLLDHEDIASRGNNLLDEVNDVLLLLLKDTVHGGVVVHNNVILKVSLGGGQAELDETDLGVLNSLGTSSEVGDLVVGEAESINELGVIDSSTKLHRDSDVFEVDVVICFVDYLQHGVHSHGGKHVRVRRHDLGRKASDAVLDEDLSVVQVNGGSHLVDDLASLFVCNIKTI